jgi:hypothetical protein
MPTYYQSQLEEIAALHWGIRVERAAELGTHANSRNTNYHRKRCYRHCRGSSWADDRPTSRTRRWNDYDRNIIRCTVTANSLCTASRSNERLW